MDNVTGAAAILTLSHHRRREGSVVDEEIVYS